MKNLYLLFIVLLIFGSAQSQFQPKIYAGLQGIYDKGFESNVYGSFEAGAELFQYKFLAPEIGLKYYTGSPNELEILNFDPNPPVGIGKFDSRFKSFVFSIGPKLIFGNEEAALVILPEYNVGNIRTFKRFFNAENNSYLLTEDINNSQNINFWNFSAGVQGNLFDLDRITFSVLITYSTLDSEEAFDNLDFRETSKKYSAGSKDGIGLTLRAYFDIF